MDLLSQIIKANSLEEVDDLVTKKIQELNEKAPKGEELGVYNGSACTKPHKGFLAQDTKIRFDASRPVTYDMSTTDFLYSFARKVKEANVTNKGDIINAVQPYLNSYFKFAENGKYKQDPRADFLFQKAEQKGIDEDSEDLNMTLGDFKGRDVAMCTERGAAAQQILSMFDFESYYCIGCVDNDKGSEPHCFNVVKREKAGNYALLDYSLPITINANGQRRIRPFMGIMSKENFEEFINNKKTIMFDRSASHYGPQRLSNIRKYVVGKSRINEIEKDANDSHDERDD